MKKETDFNFAKMNKEQLTELTTTVNEIAATDILAGKSFTIIDLWNIQRSSKARTQKKHLVL